MRGVMPDKGESSSPLRFAAVVLPWLLAAVMAALYLLTLNPWVAPESLDLVAIRYVDLDVADRGRGTVGRTAQFAQDVQPARDVGYDVAILDPAGLDVIREVREETDFLAARARLGPQLETDEHRDKQHDPEQEPAKWGR